MNSPDDSPEVGGNTKTPTRFRNWLLTEFNENFFKFYEHKCIKYEVYQIEKCPETGKLHKQSYIELKESVPLSWIKKNINNAVHAEPRRGSQDDAIKYCTKEDTRVEGPFEQGTIKAQGARTDLDNVAELCKKKTPIKEIANEYPTTYIKYHRGIEKLIALQYEHRTDAPRVEWLWGDTGVGKTRTCVERHTSYYIKDSTKWWDGYTQQEAIIIDDYNPDGYLDLRYLLKLTDRYHLLVENKGGYIPVNSPHIYITYDKPPNEIWHGKELEQISRRIIITKL